MICPLAQGIAMLVHGTKVRCCCDSLPNMKRRYKEMQLGEDISKDLCSSTVSYSFFFVLLIYFSVVVVFSSAGFLAVVGIGSVINSCLPVRQCLACRNWEGEFVDW